MADEVGAGAAPKLNPPVAGAVAEPRLRLLVGAGAEKLHRKMVSRKSFLFTASSFLHLK